MSPNPPRTTPRKITEALEQNDLMQRKLAGMTNREIARQDGISEQAVSQRLKRAIQATRAEATPELIALHHERLEKLHQAHWAVATEEITTPSPEAPAEALRAFNLRVLSRARSAEVVLRTEERQAKLHGIDHGERRADFVAQQQVDRQTLMALAGAVNRGLSKVADLTDQQREAARVAIAEELAALDAAPVEVVAGEVEE